MASPAEAAGAPAGLRERGKRRRTERILDSALGLLREDPEQTPTIERISERAEVAPMTIFNLVGNRERMWSAMADRALQDLDLESISADDPQQRAHLIVDTVVKILCADAEVFRGEAGRLVTSPVLGAPLFIRTSGGQMYALASNGRWVGAGLEPGLRSPVFVG